MSVFGFSTQPNPSGDFLPIVKYDARAGRMFRVDRVDTGQGFVNEPVDITSTFKAIVDFENLETGWIAFGGGRPDFKLVRIGEKLPPQPTAKDEKGKDLYSNGIRFMLKLSKECGGAKPIRELAGVAKAFTGAVEKVYLEYVAGRLDAPSKLPVLIMEGSTPIKSGTGDKSSTNYAPNFKIVSWVDRPQDLVWSAKDSGGQVAVPFAPASSSTTPTTSIIPSNPPSTGSTRVDPPRASAPAIEDDFG